MSAGSNNLSKLQPRVPAVDNNVELLSQNLMSVTSQVDAQSNRLPHTSSLSLLPQQKLFSTQLLIWVSHHVVNDREVQLDLIFGSPEIFTASRANELILAQEPCHRCLFLPKYAPCPPNARYERPYFIRNIEKCNQRRVKQDLQHTGVQLENECSNVYLLFFSFCSQLSTLIKFNSPASSCEVGRWWS